MAKPRPLYRFYERRLAAGLDPRSLPKHVGVLVDGNRRWARQCGATTVAGHEAGAQKIVEFLDWCRELEIEVVTLYILSTENLKRPAAELEPLLGIISDLVDTLTETGHHRVQLVGALELLPPALAARLAELTRRTAHHPGPHLNIAVGYGGRQEIVDAVRVVLTDALDTGADLRRLAQELTVEDIARHLYTRGQPDPDLLIRTSGEQRLSGFLLWQSAHSEFWFCEAYWPDFRRVDFLRALRDYSARHRRFGG